MSTLQVRLGPDAELARRGWRRGKASRAATPETKTLDPAATAAPAGSSRPPNTGGPGSGPSGTTGGAGGLGAARIRTSRTGLSVRAARGHHATGV
jgi:hypothetical protein